MQLFYQPEISNGVSHLSPEESKHCVKVLRKKEGDELSIVDGFGVLYKGTIAKADPKKCSFTVTDTIREEEKDYAIHIAVAPTKNTDRLEWLIEKAVELGVDKISFFQCDHSERNKLNFNRLVKKAISAMKQSLKYSLPELVPLQNFSSFLEKTVEGQKFIAFVDESLPGHLKDRAVKGGEYLVLIGPEGDFSKAEIDLALRKGFGAVSLGKSRLRTETAALAACHILNLINE